MPTVTPAGNFTVTGLKLTAAGISDSLDVASCQIGGTFTPPPGMNLYTAAFIIRLIKEGSISVTVTGQTDAPPGTTIKISDENDLLFTASRDAMHCVSTPPTTHIRTDAIHCVCTNNE
jgi:hypothetical protein